MSPPPAVFISYARVTAGTDALSLKAALGSSAFVDASDVETAAQFPAQIAMALLDCKLAVIFADEEYFKRPFCRWELEILLAPFYRGETGLDHVIITKPSNGRYCLSSLPPELRSRNWDVADLPGFLDRRLADPSLMSLRDRLDRSACRHLLESVLNLAHLPPVESLAGIPHCGIGAFESSLNDRFVGRATQLAQLDHRLRERHLSETAAVAITTAVHASGGFGKTRLALEYVHRYGSKHFPGGIFWMQCESDVDQQFYDILQTLDPTVPPINVLRREGTDLALLLRLRIAARVNADKPVLFVLDNVPETHSAPTHLSQYCPALNLATILVTSRQRQPGIETILLHELAATPAWLLLTMDIGDRYLISDSAWDEITTWVGRLPLALEILNRALIERAISIDALLQRARTNETTPELDELADALPEVPRNVTETLEISYQSLSLEAQYAARCLAELAPDPIPEVLIGALGTTIDEPRIRSELFRHAFITGSVTHSVPMFGSMHRVLASFLRTKTRLANSTDEQRRATAAASTILQTYDFRTPKSWKTLNAILPHVATLMNDSDEALARLGSLAAMGRFAQGDFTGARVILESVVPVRKRLWGTAISRRCQA